MKYRVIEDGNGRFNCQIKSGYFYRWEDYNSWDHDGTLASAMRYMNEKMLERKRVHNSEKINKIIVSE